MKKYILIRFLCLLTVGFSTNATAQQLTIVELNAENMFDTQHDSLKNDHEWLPTATRHWTRRRYWDKLNRIGQTIVACGETEAGWTMPDLVALCEVENDSVLHDLTKRSLLRRGGYEYVMTNSPDVRGIDVALLYLPLAFDLITTHSIRVEPLPDMRPTRDILYAAGRVQTGDTLHLFVLHAPSRWGGERATRPYRLHVVGRLCEAIDSVRAVSPSAKIIALGDFNDDANGAAPHLLEQHGMVNATKGAVGHHGAKGTYKYQGKWESIDHIFITSDWATMPYDSLIFDTPFLLTEDEKYSGVQPRRNYIGPRYQHGFSDHLPLVLRIAVR